MKKYLTGLIAVVTAISFLAFTKSTSNNDSKTSYYWFKLNATTGNPKDATSLPPHQATDPFSCSGSADFCSGGYPGYIDNGDGTYSASGTRVPVTMKN